MTWIAIADHTEQLFDLNGLDSNLCIPDDDTVQFDTLLVRGSLMIETRLSPDGKPQELLNYRNSDHWLRTFALHAIPGGGISLVIAQNDDVNHSTVKYEYEGRTDVVRVTYAWDAPRKWARLSMENTDGTNTRSVQIPNPRPLRMSDLRSLFLDLNKRYLSEDIVFLALSDQIEPIGPTPTMSQDVPLETAQGYRRIRDLKRGDLVQTEKEGFVPVLQMLKRTVPAKGSFRPIRLRAPFFGLRQDIVVAPDQRLVIRGSEVEYQFGQEAVLVPARHLVNGKAARFETGVKTITYSQILLPGHETVIAAGAAAESAFIGRLRRKPDLLRESLLGDFDRNTLPEHGHAVYPVLRWFDAITLAETRAA